MGLTQHVVSQQQRRHGQPLNLLLICDAKTALKGCISTVATVLVWPQVSLFGLYLVETLGIILNALSFWFDDD